MKQRGLWSFIITLSFFVFAGIDVWAGNNGVAVSGEDLYNPDRLIIFCPEEIYAGMGSHSPFVISESAVPEGNEIFLTRSFYESLRENVDKEWFERIVGR